MQTVNALPSSHQKTICRMPKATFGFWKILEILNYALLSKNKTAKLHPLKPFTCIYINNKGIIVQSFSKKIASPIAHVVTCVLQACNTLSNQRFSDPNFMGSKTPRMKFLDFYELQDSSVATFQKIFRTFGLKCRKIETYLRSWVSDMLFERILLVEKTDFIRWINKVLTRTALKSRVTKRLDKRHDTVH